MVAISGGVRRLGAWLAGMLLLALTACGGGGGGSPPPPPPVILASLVGFPSYDEAPAGSLPPGTNSALSVAVFDASSGAPITDAAVSVNGAALVYVPAFQDYEAALNVAPGAAVALRVTVGGATYAVDAAQFSAYPTITAPVAGASWSLQDSHLVAWTGVAPSADAVFALSVLDTNGAVVWPSGDAIEVVPSTTTSYTIPAGVLSAGSRLVLVGVATALQIPYADPNSAIVIGGFKHVPITVTSGPVTSLVSIAVSPATRSLGKGKTLQFTATGTYSDNSTQDLTTQVTWSTSSAAVASVTTTGLVSGVDYGSTTISATLGSVSGSATVTVFQPTPSPAPPLARSVTYQIDYAHSGRAVFGTPLVLPPSAGWSVALPGAVSYPLVADGKVFVTTAGPASGGGLYGTQLFALDAQTGAIAWGPVAISGTYFWSGHAYDNGKLFVVNFDGLLRSFDAASGQPGWSVQLPGQYAFTSPPTAVNGIVYVGGAGSGGTVYAVDQTNGNVLWTAAVGNGDHSSPAVSSDGVFVSYPCQVYKLDPLSGATLWHYAGPCSGGGGRTAAYADDRLYVRDWTDPVSRVFDAANGNVVGTFGAGPIPALTPQTDYFMDSGTLRAIDRATQQVRWSFAGDGSLTSAPIVIDQVVFVGSTTGLVYALDATTGTLLWTGAAGAAISAPDEQNVTQPLTGFGVGEGMLIVPAGSVLTAWRITGP